MAHLLDLYEYFIDISVISQLAKFTSVSIRVFAPFPEKHSLDRSQNYDKIA